MGEAAEAAEAAEADGADGAAEAEQKKKESMEAQIDPLADDCQLTAVRIVIVCSTAIQHWISVAITNVPASAPERGNNKPKLVPSHHQSQMLTTPEAS